jgi:peptide/nickel transport system permease protein
VTGYLVRRLGQALLVVLGVVFLVFVLSQVIPGGEARAVLGARASAAQIAHFNKVNGFTKPIIVQFWNYLVDLVHLRLGYSYEYTTPIWTLIRIRLPKTLVLVGTSTVIALFLAIPLGVFQVVRRHKAEDYLLTGVSFFLYATPTFFLAALLILLFSFDAHLLPVAPPFDASPFAVFTDPIPFIMPVCTLAATTVALFSRYARSSLLDALAEDYIRTARGKGAGRGRVLLRHALRNALIPVITLVGLTLPAIVSGAVVVENVFNYPGMGLLAVQAAENHDIPTVLATTLVVTVATVAGSLLADLLYLAVDPRIRYVDR